MPCFEPVKKYLGIAEQYVIDCNWREVIRNIDLAFTVAWEIKRFNGSDDELVVRILRNYDYSPQDSLENLTSVFDLRRYKDILNVKSPKNVTEFLNTFVEYMSLADLDKVMYIVVRESCQGAPIWKLFDGYSKRHYSLAKSVNIAEGQTSIIDGLKYTRVGDSLVSSDSVFTYQLDTGDEDSFTGWNPTEDVFEVMKSKGKLSAEATEPKFSENVSSMKLF